MASIGKALFPRSTELASLPPYHPRALLGAGFDLASAPGRAYASLGRPSAESFSDAMARTGPTGAMPGPMYQSEGDEFADMVLRDPFLPLGAVLSAAAPFRALGQYGRAAVEGVTNTAGSVGDQYASQGRAELGPALLSGLAGAAPGMLPQRRGVGAAMITPEERAANFRNWFGDSKVVDEAGNPLVVYHGTSSDFGAFDPGKAGRTYRADKRGIFFAEDPEQANNAAIDSRFSVGGSESIMPTNLRVERPYSPGLTTQQFDEANKAEVFRAAKKAGADGIRLDDGTWIALSPTQIKSATGNRGTFNPNDPNITHLAASRSQARHVDPLQSIGSRLSAQAKHAALREYLSDDRPQGDTPYTRSSR